MFCLPNLVACISYSSGVSIRAGSRLHSRLLRFLAVYFFSKEDFFANVFVDRFNVTWRTLMDQFQICLPPYQVISLPAKLRMRICGLP